MNQQPDRYTKTSKIPIVRGVVALFLCGAIAFYITPTQRDSGSTSLPMYVVRLAVYTLIPILGAGGAVLIIEFGRTKRFFLLLITAFVAVPLASQLALKLYQYLLTV